MDAKQLKQICPLISSKSLLLYLPELNKLMPQFEINTPLRQAHFLAQVAHESAQFFYVKEIASGEAYEGRKDLGNTVKGYGVKYKGRGAIQCTGYFNYIKFFKWLGGAPDIINHPEYLEQPHLAIMVSCWFWQTHGLNELADKDDIFAISKTINGINRKTKLPNGYAERKAYLAKAKLALNV